MHKYLCSMYSQSKKEKKKPSCLFQYKLLYRNETCTNHYRLLSISISYFEIFIGVSSIWISLPNFNFFNVNLQFFQRNRKVDLTNCLVTNFRNIYNISSKVIRRRNYGKCENVRGKFFS